MRMLNSSAVLNGQPAILAWSVTSIQLPPETIQACPINQPVRYPAIPEPTPIPAFSLCLFPSLSLSLSLPLILHPSSLNAKPCLSPSSPCGPHPTFRFLLNPPSLSWQTARSTSNLVLVPVPLSPSIPANSIPLARQSSTPRIDNFFSTLSNPCLGACPLNESPPRRCTSSDVHNRETCDACHTSLALGVSEMPSLAFARVFFCRSTRATAVLDLAEVLEQPR